MTNQWWLYTVTYDHYRWNGDPEQALEHYQGDGLLFLACTDGTLVQISHVVAITPAE